MNNNHIEIAQIICEYFKAQPEVMESTIYGSLASGSFDKYSDIDIEIDVSGSDNGHFLKKVPHFINNIYPVIYSDYAPSLLPEEYVVSCAISSKNPFLIVDVKCIATPHIYSITKIDIVNNFYSHILKLWVANMKHYIRGNNCGDDIRRMYKKIFTNQTNDNPASVLKEVFSWLVNNQKEQYNEYLESCKAFIKLI